MRPRRYPTILPEFGGASVGRKSHSRFAQSKWDIGSDAGAAAILFFTAFLSSAILSLLPSLSLFSSLSFSYSLVLLYPERSLIAIRSYGNVTRTRDVIWKLYLSLFTQLRMHTYVYMSCTYTHTSHMTLHISALCSTSICYESPSIPRSRFRISSDFKDYESLASATMR